LPFSGILALRSPAQHVAFLNLPSFGFAKFASGTAFSRGIMLGARLARFDKFGGGSLVSGF
jgi:hypothetical protein